MAPNITYTLVSWWQQELSIVAVWDKCPEPEELFFIDSDLDVAQLDLLYLGEQISTVSGEVYRLFVRMIE